MAKAKVVSKKAAGHPELAKGATVLVRTVTNYFTGRVESVSEGFLRLTEAAWIASTGRFSNALATGQLDEVEPYPDAALISIGCISDISIWKHALPLQVK